MTKQNFVAIPLYLCVLSTFAQKKFTITGKLTGLKTEKKVFLFYKKDNGTVTDSTITKNGAFTFSSTVKDMPSKASLELREINSFGQMSPEQYMSRDAQDFFIDSKITVAGEKLKTAKITAGVTQAEYGLLKDKLKPLSDQMDEGIQKFAAMIQNKDTTGRSRLIERQRSIRSEITKVEEEFIRTNPNSFVSLDLLETRAPVIETKTFEPLYNSLSEKLKKSPRGVKLGEKLTLTKKTDIGQPAIFFTQPNATGEQFSLASLKGKYVLVDFWASWCGPCRAENPNVVKAYNEFKGKNFEIVSVSLDNKKDAWLKAIQTDGLTWIHVSDLLGWKNAVAVEYGIQAVPQNFLIDPNGIIIAKNLRGEDLANKLSEFVKK